ncbi:MAG TPA: hypothetical protein VFZ23_03645 [Pyrinomonadaceae bacterium]
MNPGRYGAELAYWLCGKLAEANFVTSYPNYEDWGWFLDYTTGSGEEFRLCCGNVDGGDDEWMCFLEPLSKGFFKGKADPALASGLMAALDQILQSTSEISNIEWSKEAK